MRISNRIMAEQIKVNLAKQSRQLMQTQLKLATGKRINKPSDDPTGMAKVLDSRTTLKTIEQYHENIIDAQTRIEQTETILGQINDLVDDAKKIASNPATEDKAALSQEISNIRDQVVELANSKYGANYLFAGHSSDSPPFDLNSPYAYNGDSGIHRVVVGEGMSVQIEADGSGMFIDGGDNLFQVLEDLETSLTTDPFDPATAKNTVDPLYRISDRIELTRSNLASDYKRLEKTDAYWNKFSDAVEGMRQKVEDADITQTAVDMQTQKTAYEVLLATAARVIQPTLVDFLG